MDNDLIKIEEAKLKLQNLVSVRQNATQSLIVLIGGVVGLCFTPDTVLKYFFIILGVTYIVILGKNLYHAEASLKEICTKKNWK